MRSGRAESHINPIGEYFGAGAVYTGLLARDGKDQLGLALAVAKLGVPFRHAQAARGAATSRREYAWELTYRVQLGEWLALQPDVQYVRHPGMDPLRSASWLFGLRLDLTKAWSR
jgi:porin